MADFPEPKSSVGTSRGRYLTMCTFSAAVEAQSNLKDRAVVYALLPWTQMVVGLYFYSCLPLHFIDMGLDLVDLGLVVGGSVSGCTTFLQADQCSCFGCGSRSSRA